MNLLETAAGLLGDKLGIGAAQTIPGLQKLFGGSSDDLDIGALVTLLQQGGLGETLSSWLGDGANGAVDTAALENALGAGKISDAADSMGVGSGDLLSGLAEVLPRLIDQVSSGGNLLDSIGGLGGIGDITKRLF